MAILATNNVGAYGVPGAGVFQPGETKEVTLAVARYLMTRPEFSLEFTDVNDLSFRNPEGRIDTVGFLGAVDTRFGYGSAAINLLRALHLADIRAVLHPNAKVYRPDLHPDAAVHLTYKDVPRVELIHHLPTHFSESSAPVRIGYSMWETSRIPDSDEHPFGDWVAPSNEMDALFVPSQHSKQVFEESGVKVPIAVVPYGIDTDEWEYIDRPERDTFTVVQYGDLSSRKGPIEAVQAFQRAFPREMDVRLVLKTFRKLGSAKGILPSFRDSRIEVIDSMWSRNQLRGLLARADAFIWLSRGEGFGLPPLQAALTGLPVITTTHTGMAEYYDGKFFYGVGSSGTSEAPLGGEWYETDVEQAAEQLRKVYDDRKAARRRGKSASTYTRKKFGLDSYRDRLVSALEKF